MSRRIPIPPLDAARALLCGALTIAACSFQDFDYLQGAASRGGSGVGGNEDDGGTSEAGGTSGSGTTSGSGGNGGENASGGARNPDGGRPSTAGSNATGGTGGILASHGGVAGVSGPRAGEGGASGGDGGGSLGGAPTEGGQGGWAGEGGGKDGPPLGNLLVNPSFEQGLVGWSVDPPSAVVSRYVYTQYPTGGKLAKDGTQELATWDETDEYSLYIYQTVTGLVPGVYSFSGFFSSQQSRGAHLFARNCGGAEQQEVIPTVSLDWFEIGIPEVMVSGTSCEVGFFVHGVAQDWLNADMFTFERVP